MTSMTSIKSLILDLPPSCIEFCHSAPEFFVVGTYYLEKKEEENASTESAGVEDEDSREGEGEGIESDEAEGEDEITESQDEGEGKVSQKRTGTLILCRVEGDDVDILQTLPTPHAILDLHFSPHDPTLFAIATSTGSLVLYRLSPSSKTLTHISTHQVFPFSTLVLSLHWHPTQPQTIGVTLSTGSVHLCNLDSTQPPTTEILSHDLEAWTLSLTPTTVYSGGDDATLRFCDTETGIEWNDRRIHGAGVTAILPLEQEDTVVTGSYDDSIRVLHTPKMGRRSVLTELDLGGGVWRLKMLDVAKDSKCYTILASCMHAGARIVSVTAPATPTEEWTIEILAKFEEHQSMNYGSDVMPDNNTTKTIVSTSFYDKLLCLWRWDTQDV